jgi:hypothetical protein
MQRLELVGLLLGGVLFGYAVLTQPAIREQAVWIALGVWFLILTCCHGDASRTGHGGRPPRESSAPTTDPRPRPSPHA